MVAPVATVTEAGTVRAALLSDRVTAVPPVGAAWERVTVQLEEPPETTVIGLQLNDVMVVVAGGVTVTDAVAVLPFSEALMVAD